MPTSSAIHVNSFGVGTHHPTGFMRNRKKYTGFLFLHFLTPHRIHFGERVVFREAGECFIYTPNTPQHYGSNGLIAFGNDWMHLSGSGVLPLLKNLELPLNTPMNLGSSAFVPKHLQAIGLEISEHRLHWEMGVELKVRDFFLELCRAVNNDDKGRLAPRNEEMHERLNRLRLEMQARCAEKWSLERMLEQVHMSRSKFALYYRRLFKVSPLDDLIAMRIQLAKEYLETTDFSVTHIADTCGFSDVYYFCKIFKKRIGLPPGQYRKNPISTAPTVMSQIWKDGKPVRHQKRYARKETRGK